METLRQQIAELLEELKRELKAVANDKDLEVVRVMYLSRQGKVLQFMKEMLEKASPTQKREFGIQLNSMKQHAHQMYDEKQNELDNKIVKDPGKKLFDVTISKYTELRGTTHVYTQFLDELCDIFSSMGYQVVDGPEVELDYYNFEALNIAPDHPARDMHDTFWIEGRKNILLRTHTSNMEPRHLERREFPLAIFAPGRVYRNEATDASHDFMFMQGELLFVDKNVSMAHLIATARTFLQAIFDSKEINIRIRPSYFPFVEPGVEIDASCPFCKDGCSICKKTGWIELLGAGLTHPNVLRASNVDPEVYSGFAMGFGITRLAMIKYGITDLRLFHATKIPFLDQF